MEVAPTSRRARSCQERVAAFGAGGTALITVVLRLDLALDVAGDCHDGHGQLDRAVDLLDRHGDLVSADGARRSRTCRWRRRGSRRRHQCSETSTPTDWSKLDRWYCTRPLAVVAASGGEDRRRRKNHRRQRHRVASDLRMRRNEATGRGVPIQVTVDIRRAGERFHTEHRLARLVAQLQLRPALRPGEHPPRAAARQQRRRGRGRRRASARTRTATWRSSRGCSRRARAPGQHGQPTGSSTRASPSA